MEYYDYFEILTAKKNLVYTSPQWGLSHLLAFRCQQCTGDVIIYLYLIEEYINLMKKTSGVAY